MKGRNIVWYPGTLTKWVEIFPTGSADAQTVAKALLRDIIPRFGIPERIYSDNGPHFVIKKYTTFDRSDEN